jgi:hypothetical protein
MGALGASAGITPPTDPIHCHVLMIWIRALIWLGQLVDLSAVATDV